MQSAKKFYFRLLKIVLIFYILLCAAVYFFQEKIIFHPGILDKNYQFTFEQPFEELSIKTKAGYSLNGVLIKSDSSKGVIFFLHGNTGALNRWASVAKAYTDLHYDIFILDYPGFGKSESSINSETQMFTDVQSAYEEIKKRYNENQIVVIGFSIGTGPATKIASENNPRLLVLQAPYYSLTDLMKKEFKILPTFLLKYKFETGKYLTRCAMPVIIFHGDADEVIYYGSSLKLQQEFKKGDTLITLSGQKHNGITYNPAYIAAVSEYLK